MGRGSILSHFLLAPSLTIFSVSFLFFAHSSWLQCADQIKTSQQPSCIDTYSRDKHELHQLWLSLCPTKHLCSICGDHIQCTTVWCLSPHQISNFQACYTTVVINRVSRRCRVLKLVIILPIKHASHPQIKIFIIPQLCTESCKEARWLLTRASQEH